MKRVGIACLMSCFCLISYGVIKEKTSYVGAEEEPTIAALPYIPNKPESTIGRTQSLDITTPPDQRNLQKQGKPTTKPRPEAIEATLQETAQKAKKVERSVSAVDKELARLQTELNAERDKGNLQGRELIKLQKEHEQLGGRQKLVLEAPLATTRPIYVREPVVDEPKTRDRAAVHEMRKERRKLGERPKEIPVIAQPVIVQKPVHGSLSYEERRNLVGIPQKAVSVVEQPVKVQVVEELTPNERVELLRLRRENEELRGRLGE